MPSRNDVFEKLKVIVVDKLSVSESEVSEDAAFFEDLGADSLDIVDLVMGIEEEFDIQIPDEHVERIATVRHAIEYILDSHTGH
jgi:acyl carrier protein